MSKNPPIFPFLQPQELDDYVFDPQTDFFRKNILEETRKHKSLSCRSIDALRFKTQKPISKKNGGGRRRWWNWNTALPFFKWKKCGGPLTKTDGDTERGGAHRNRARVRSVSTTGPLYYISNDSRSGSGKFHQAVSRPSCTPLAGTLTPARKGELEIPYVSLGDFNTDKQQYRMSTTPSSTMPIYFVS